MYSESISGGGRRRRRRGPVGPHRRQQLGQRLLAPIRVRCELARLLDVHCGGRAPQRDGDGEDDDEAAKTSSTCRGSHVDQRGQVRASQRKGDPCFMEAWSRGALFISCSVWPRGFAAACMHASLWSSGGRAKRTVDVHFTRSTGCFPF